LGNLNLIDYFICPKVMSLFVPFDVPDAFIFAACLMG